MNSSGGCVILHVDMDCFFVSVERVLNPALNGKPVLVGGDLGRRGIVASASYEARAFGVRSAMSMAEARRRCPGAVVVSTRHGRYAEFSARALKIFERFTPRVEMASVDEAYLDLSGTERLWGPPWQAAERLRQAVRGETGLPCSIGLATSKVVAKVASKLSKPYGFLWVFAGREAAFLAPLPLRALPGIGPRTAESLGRYGLVRVGELAELGQSLLRGLFGWVGQELWERATGRRQQDLAAPRKPKSIGSERTFQEDMEWPGPVRGMLGALADLVAASLRKEGLMARTVTLRLRTADFKTRTISRTLPHATQDAAALFAVADDLLRKNWNGRIALRLVGLTASKLTEASLQWDLFDHVAQERLDRLNRAMDAVRRRHGFLAIRKAAECGYLDEALREPAAEDGGAPPPLRRGLTAGGVPRPFRPPAAPDPVEFPRNKAPRGNS